MKKLISLTLASIMAVGVLASCSPAKTGDAVAITFLNSKGEIQTQLEEMADKYQKETGVSIEVVSTSTGGSPFEKISSMYNSGNPPTLAMLDTTDILALAKEKALDLSGEKWVADAGEMVKKIDDKVYSFPFCVEGRGLIYNKTAIEKTLGTDFDPASIKTFDDLKKILEELKAKGMETPMVLSKEDWSLGAHYLGLVYESQGKGTLADNEKFISDLKAGTVKLNEDKRFTEYMNTLDLLLEYNYNKKDPLAAVYAEDASYVADGTCAFWFNGNWAWNDMTDFVDDKTEYGIIPLVVNNDAADFANTSVQALPSKQVMIDKEKSTPEQQQAAKDFLNWLVYDEKGQNFMIEDAALVPAFKNITKEPVGDLGISIKKYVDAGLTFEGAITPGDHWAIVGADMQAYIAGKITREELAGKIEVYWASQK